MKGRRIKLIFWLLILVFGATGIFLFNNKVFAQELININTASLEELDSLPGIGEAKAQAIIDYRNENGIFETIEQIMEVSGIGQATFDNIKNLITVAGTANQVGGSGQIVINEVLPNPEGSDETEWVELKNTGGELVDVSYWRLIDAAEKEYIFEVADINTVIEPGQFLILERVVTGIALNNSGGEELKLFDSLGNLIFSIAYTDVAREGFSWARQDEGNYSWTEMVTKNSDNVFAEEEPIEEREEETPVEVAPIKEEKYQGKILISELMINPLGIDNDFNEWIEINNTSTREIILKNWKLSNGWDEYVLKRVILPPKSFVVLRRGETNLKLNNFSEEKISLFDEEGKVVAEVKYKKNSPEGESYSWCPDYGGWIWIPKSSIMAVNNCPQVNENPQAYFEASRQELIHNQTVRFNAEESYDEDGEILKYIWEFEAEVENITTGEINKFFEEEGPQLEVRFGVEEQQEVKLTVVDNLGGENSYEQVFGKEEKVLKEIGNNKIQEIDNLTGETDNIFSVYNYDGLLSLRELPKGMKVSFEGWVIAEPGTLGVNIFYIQNENEGIQVYCYAKDFPLLGLGDLIKVTGELSSVNNETRIKINGREDVEIVESGNRPEPWQVEIGTIADEMEGELVQISGEIVEDKYDYYWVADGTGEIKVVLQKTTGIEKQALGLKEGDKVIMVGIVSETQTGFRILPRFKEDMVVKQILGQQEQAKQNSSQQGLLKYLIVGVLFVAMVLVILIIKRVRLAKKTEL